MKPATFNNVNDPPSMALTRKEQVFDEREPLCDLAKLHRPEFVEHATSTGTDFQTAPLLELMKACKDPAVRAAAFGRWSDKAAAFEPAVRLRVALELAGEAAETAVRADYNMRSGRTRGQKQGNVALLVINYCLMPETPGERKSCSDYAAVVEHAFDKLAQITVLADWLATTPLKSSLEYVRSKREAERTNSNAGYKQPDAPAPIGGRAVSDESGLYLPHVDNPVGDAYFPLFVEDAAALTQIPGPPQISILVSLPTDLAGEVQIYLDQYGNALTPELVCFVARARGTAWAQDLIAKLKLGAASTSTSVTVVG